ncbi:MAG: hypothetical protein ACP5QO_14560 [Clostridia bacterium]
MDKQTAIRLAALEQARAGLERAWREDGGFTPRVRALSVWVDGMVVAWQRRHGAAGSGMVPADGDRKALGRGAETATG